MIGDKDVGKSRLIGRYYDYEQVDEGWINYYNFDYDECPPTTEEVFKQKSVYLDVADRTVERVKFSLKIIDTPGGDESKLSFDYKEADGIIVCYDITNKETFQSIPNWLHKINECSQHCVVMMVGTKLDLNNERKISKKEAQVKCVKIRIIL